MEKIGLKDLEGKTISKLVYNELYPDELILYFTDNTYTTIVTDCREWESSTLSIGKYSLEQLEIK